MNIMFKMKNEVGVEFITTVIEHNYNVSFDIYKYKTENCDEKYFDVTTNIKYIGYIKNLRNLYASVNFTVLPAYIEPFGLVIIESIACGTPVITSPFVGANSLIKNNGLIMPGLSVECLVKTLKIAQTSKFKIDAHIIQNNELTLENHINKVLDII